MYKTTKKKTCLLMNTTYAYYNTVLLFVLPQYTHAEHH